MDGYRPVVSIDSSVASSGIASATSGTIPREQGLQLVELDVRAVIAIQSSRPLDLRGHGMERAVDVIGRAEIA